MAIQSPAQLSCSQRASREHIHPRRQAAWQDFRSSHHMNCVCVPADTYALYLPILAGMSGGCVSQAPCTANHSHGCNVTAQQASVDSSDEPPVAGLSTDVICVCDNLRPVFTNDSHIFATNDFSTGGCSAGRCYNGASSSPPQDLRACFASQRNCIPDHLACAESQRTKGVTRPTGVVYATVCHADPTRHISGSLADDPQPIGRRVYRDRQHELAAQPASGGAWPTVALIWIEAG